MNGYSEPDLSKAELGSVRRPLSFRSRQIPKSTPETLRRVERLAAEIRLSEPRIDDLSPFGTGVNKGVGPGPCVWFGDTAEIPLLGQDPDKRFDYRLGWLAQDRDIVVIGGPHCTAFEAYQRHWLAARGIRYLNVDPDTSAPRRATSTICLRDTATFCKLCEALADEPSVTLHAYITTGTIWALATRLNQMTGVDVFVAGPPPLLSRRANDKLWFGDVVQRLLGTGAIPPKRAAYSSSSLTRHVADLAREWDRLVVKVPDSAGSAGNFPVRSKDVRGLAPAALSRHLMRQLSVHGRAPVFPMLVEVWDANVLTSPSVQTWIPALEDGPPVIEAIFEQVLYGEYAAFAGAACADLPPKVEDELTSGAFQIATLFQRLGYFGRCSFDAIVTGPRLQAASVHWIECNARWGGASVPMSLVHRLTASGEQPQYAIVQNATELLPPLDFADALLLFADLEPPPDFRFGTLFLSPNLMESGTGCHFLSFGSDAKAATGLALSTIERLRASSEAGGNSRDMPAGPLA